MSVTRIFGGKEAQPSGKYDRPLLNPNLQAVAETLAVGTHRRVFRGPSGDGPHWSYFVSVTEAGGATSTLKFYYSNLPNPDPTVAAHWKDSGIVAIDLAAAAQSHDTRGSTSPEWIMAEAVVVANTADVLAYVRVNGVDE